jgi:hypothetical protein
MDRHAPGELTIFGEFALVCPLGIEANSIEKRDPPQADILCKLADGVSVAFEMVELVDQLRIAKPMADQDQLTDSLRDAVKNLPVETRAELANAWIGVKFRLDRSLRKRKESAAEVVKILAANAAFEGEFSIRDGNAEVAHANVKRRQGLAGPHFRVLTAGFYEPVPLDAIDEKFDKKYEGEAPLELLAHYDRQHAPLEEQLAELGTFVEANIARSSFRRVWIFDRHDQRICYPNL